jgi:hypothetical protein
MGLKITDNSAQVTKSMKALARKQVFVGIPEQTATRKKSKINNAALLFVLSKGSPLRGIPARPVLEPAIEAKGNKEPIADELGKAASAALEGNEGECDKHLKRAGMTAQNSAREWITDPRNGFAPNSPSTIRRKGSDKPLIDTGAMRKAITFVVEDSE